MCSWCMLFTCFGEKTCRSSQFSSVFVQYSLVLEHSPSELILLNIKYDAPLKKRINTHKLQLLVTRATFSCNVSGNNVASQVESVCCNIATSAQQSKSDVYFLQHENLLSEKVVIRAANNLNLQRNTVHCCLRYEDMPTYFIMLRCICKLIFCLLVIVVSAIFFCEL